jgi:hypothetical protein
MAMETEIELERRSSPIISSLFSAIKNVAGRRTPFCLPKQVNHPFFSYCTDPKTKIYQDKSNEDSSIHHLITRRSSKWLHSRPTVWTTIYRFVC